MIPAREPGSLVRVDRAGLVAAARRADCVLELVPVVGDFVLGGAPLFRVHPGPGRAGDLAEPTARLRADRLTFAAIEKGIREFAKRAEDGTLSLADLKGGTFTITNGGVFGSLLSTPILNPPQVAILGRHKIQDRPIAANGQVIVRPMMYTALTYDHRIVDGAEAVRFLVRVKGLVEDPGALLLD